MKARISIQKKGSRIATLGIIMTLLFIQSGYSQMVPISAFAESKYGFSVTEMNMNNGQGKAYIPYFTVEKGRRGLEFGMILQDTDQVLAGFTAAFKFMLGKTDETGIFNSRSNRLNPYLFYNFNYFSKNYSTLGNSSLSNLYETYGSNVRIASHEHYLGLGMKVSFSQKVCLDVGYGFGTYIGSIENLKNAADIESIPNRNGLARMYKISLGLQIF